MRPSLWFVMPAHGRAALTRICLTQLRHTCDQLAVFGVDASAVVIADDENLDAAACLGFWGYEQDNAFLGRKFNDGYELAARQGVDYVVPLGSDDWIHPDLIAGADLPKGRIRCARRLVMVDEGGDWYMRLRIAYDGGIGMRIIPTELMQPLGYRPCGEDRKRAIDTHTLRGITTAHPGSTDSSISTSSTTSRSSTSSHPAGTSTPGRCASRTRWACQSRTSGPSSRGTTQLRASLRCKRSTHQLVLLLLQLEHALALARSLRAHQDPLRDVEEEPAEAEEDDERQAADNTHCR